MQNNSKTSPSNNHKVALITGAAVRIGAEISRTLHQNNYKVIIHYRNSADAANALVKELNDIRPESATTVGGNLSELTCVNDIAEKAINKWGHITLLVNNASSFYTTPFGTIEENHWDDLINSNLKGPFFLSQALSNTLTAHNGSIINIVDIYLQNPLPKYAPYSIAKAGVAMMTKALATELGPNVRVNGISPGVILAPSDNSQSQDEIDALIAKTTLKTIGNPKDIASTVLFLAESAGYISGQILAVDGGRSVHV